MKSREHLALDLRQLALVFVARSQEIDGARASGNPAYLGDVELARDAAWDRLKAAARDLLATDDGSKP